MYKLGSRLLVLNFGQFVVFISFLVVLCSSSSLSLEFLLERELPLKRRMVSEETMSQV
jgi:hypothetical protein